MRDLVMGLTYCFGMAIFLSVMEIVRLGGPGFYTESLVTAIVMAQYFLTVVWR